MDHPSPYSVPSGHEVAMDSTRKKGSPSLPQGDQPKIAPEDLPDLHRGLIHLEQVDELFSDITAEAQLLEVIPKWASESMVQNEKVTLQEARTLLATKRVRAIQVRYLHDQKEWWDTLLNTPEGIQVIRIEHTA